MFESILKSIKEWFKNMFTKNQVETVLGTDVALSNKMITAIDYWDSMRCGNAEWIDNDSVYSLGLEKSICKEFADITVSEMNVNVTYENSEVKSEKNVLHELFEEAIKDLNEHLQIGLALGSMIIKPLGGAKVEYVDANSFIPLNIDSQGKLRSVAFIETKQMSETLYYRRFEIHSVSEKNGLTIKNLAFKSSSFSNIGSEIPLSIVDEWASLPIEINYPKMTKPSFGYYRNPIPNTIDGSKCGVSVFDSAKYLIRNADIQYGRLNWEFESSERAVHIDISALKKETIGGETYKSVPKLNKRLFKGVDMDNQDKPFYEVYSPSIRDVNIINGMQEYKKAIELAVGLSYGDISDPTMIEKTATEIKASKKRKYNTVNQIQSNLKDCLEDLCYAMAFFNGLTSVNYEFVCTFKDSILTDEDTERKQDMADIAAGLMSNVEYRMKWNGETEEQATAAIAKIMGTMVQTDSQSMEDMRLDGNNNQGNNQS
jgi:A118 family predicted phage portal protein